MSDNLCPKDLLNDRQDLDIWRLSGDRFDPTAGRPLRRKVEFDVSQRAGDSPSCALLTTNPTNPSVATSLSRDASEPEIKLALVVLDSVNGFTQHFLIHPLLVVRRQAQVSRKSYCYHLMPFSVIGLLVRLQAKQGSAVLWKGITSVFITKAIHIGIESIICELTPCVRDLRDKRMTFETIFQHLVLKSVSIVLVTPFLCSSYVETVQSCIASESPGVFDSLKEGFLRMMLWKMDRKLPIWLLCGPTLFYYMSHYLISSCVFKISVIVLNDTNAEDSDNVSKFKARYRDIMSGFWGQLVADVMLFPLSTIITRLYLQGTRTIIDSVDTNAVTPVISNYDSTADCLATIVKEEGRTGLFRGFGALVVQYAIHYSLMRLTKYCLQKTINGLNRHK